MIVDISSMASGSAIDADLCIIGGGAAAIAICLALRDAGTKVAVLESGGLDRESATQALAAGTQSGVPYFPLDESRYRLLGGSTYNWGARTSPLKRIDFKPRAHVPLSGWPIDAETLAPFFDKAVEIIGSHPDFHYDQEVWTLLGAPSWNPSADLLEVTAFQFGKHLLLGDIYRKALSEAPNITVYLHANAVNLVTDRAGSSLRQVDIRTLGGASYKAHADRFVLAGGGIENARLLLVSNSVGTEGIGNQSGFVGRCFMEHPTASAGLIHAADPHAALDLFSPGLSNGRLVETGWALSDRLQASEACLNIYGRAVAVAGRDATQALREILWNLQHRRLPLQLSWYGKNRWLAERLTTVLSDPLSIVANAVRHTRGKPKRFRIDALHLELRSEQSPDLESRVTLSNDRDALGLPCAHLHWNLTQLERRSFRIAAQVIGAELERSGLGRLEMRGWLTDDSGAWPEDLVGGHHHMGTTRMSADPKLGVVDSNCRIHGMENLYVAGSSVFPTSGYANPTATLLALALRLAGHLVSSHSSVPSPAAE